MSGERAFLEQLLANPSDDTTRLVYADWLDESDGPAVAVKAEFLRLTAERRTARKRRRKAIERRLQVLAAGLDTEWLAVVSKLTIENCAAGGTLVDRFELRTLEFEYQCPKQWHSLRATDDDAIRFCKACGQNVYYCDTIVTARNHVGVGHCVAVDCGVLRKPDDLEPGVLVMGIVSRDFFQEREQRMKPDPVSEAREHRKAGGTR